MLVDDANPHIPLAVVDASFEYLVATAKSLAELVESTFDPDKIILIDTGTMHTMFSTFENVDNYKVKYRLWPAKVGNNTDKIMYCKQKAVARLWCTMRYPLCLTLSICCACSLLMR